jgi:shikimate dehydrogenase
MGIPYAEVIGDPIGHSKSPLIHKFWLRRLGIEGDYLATRVTPAELPDYFAERSADPDWRGCNVTMPLKEAAFALLDVDPTTRRIGALNTVRRYEELLLGHNTDWYALNIALDAYRLQPQRAVVIGTGGAARAALEELRQNRAPHVSLVSRDRAKAEALLARFGLRGDALPHGGAPEAGLLINASPLGMAGFPPLDIDLSGLVAGATVLEMVYRPLETPLLNAARAAGFHTIDGLTMLLEQAAMAFTFFFGQAPQSLDCAELRELLTR